MADFLTRLIQRTSGRASVIKPLVRSSFDALPPVNESISEFEETVSFDGINEPSSTDARPVVRDNLLDTGKRGTSVSQPLAADNLPVKPAASTPISRPKSPKKTRQEPEQVAGKDRVETLSRTKRQERNSELGPKLESQPKSTNIAPPISRKISPVSSDKIQKKSVESVPDSVTGGTPSPTTLKRIDLSDRVVPPSRRSVDISKEISDSSSPTSPMSPTGESFPVDIKSGKKEVSLYKPPADMPLQLSRRDLRISDATPPIKPVSNIVGRDMIKPEQQNNLVEVENEEVATTSSKKRSETKLVKEVAGRQPTTIDTVMSTPQKNVDINADGAKNLSDNLVSIGREESIGTGPSEAQIPPQLVVDNIKKYTPDKLSGRAIKMTSFRDEATPSTDVNVTIGRVEIRSLQHPDYQQKHTPSVLRKPTLSLDAYLKARDEEKR